MSSLPQLASPPELSDELRAFILDRFREFLRQIDSNAEEQQYLVQNHLEPGFYHPQFKADIPAHLLPENISSGEVSCCLTNHGETTYPDIALGVRFHAAQMFQARDNKPLIATQDNWQGVDKAYFTSKPMSIREGRLVELFREMMSNARLVSAHQPEHYHTPGYYRIPYNITYIGSFVDFSGEDLTSVIQAVNRSRANTDVPEQRRGGR